MLTDIGGGWGYDLIFLVSIFLNFCFEELYILCSPIIKAADRKSVV